MKPSTNSPWVHEIRPAPDPWQAFLRLFDLPYAIFFDSARRDPLHGRYSYIAASPAQLLHARGGRVSVVSARSPRLATPDYHPEEPFPRDASSATPPKNSPGEPVSTGTHAQRGGALEALGVLHARLLPEGTLPVPGLPPFQGGAAGLFGYGICHELEKIPRPRFDEFELPDLVVGLYDWVLAFDHRKGSCHLISHGHPKPTSETRAKNAAYRGQEILDRLQKAPGTPPTTDHPATANPLALDQLAASWPVAGEAELVSNFSHSDYLASVARCVEYIRAGDIFQVNLSQRFLYPARESPLELYERLRRKNPAPFASYFDMGDVVLASSSPEQFLSVNQGTVVTRPIKGTRPRGYTPEADAYGREALFRSDKDRAENIMIVDLLRNDISRVCQPHTVTVPKLFDLEGHPTVHHLVSEVHGELREGLGPLDLLRATFPGGSITGAPKVRSMEIISELEPTARGPYCGSLAWIGHDGSMNSSILIRTMTLARGWIQFPAGGGIVAASLPGSEYQETLAKAAGMVNALRA